MALQGYKCKRIDMLECSCNLCEIRELGWHNWYAKYRNRFLKTINGCPVKWLKHITDAGIRPINGPDCPKEFNFTALEEHWQKNNMIQCVNHWKLIVEEVPEHECIQISGRDASGFTKFMIKLEDAEKLVNMLQDSIETMKGKHEKTN